MIPRIMGRRGAWDNCDYLFTVRSDIHTVFPWSRIVCSDLCNGCTQQVARLWGVVAITNWWELLPR